MSITSPLNHVRPKSSTITSCKNTNLNRILSQKFHIGHEDRTNSNLKIEMNNIRFDEATNSRTDTNLGVKTPSNQWIRIKGNDMINLIPKNKASPQSSGVVGIQLLRKSSPKK